MVAGRCLSKYTLEQSGRQPDSELYMCSRVLGEVLNRSSGTDFGSLFFSSGLGKSVLTKTSVSYR